MSQLEAILDADSMGFKIGATGKESEVYLGSGLSLKAKELRVQTRANRRTTIEIDIICAGYANVLTVQVVPKSLQVIDEEFVCEIQSSSVQRSAKSIQGIPPGEMAATKSFYVCCADCLRSSRPIDDALGVKGPGRKEAERICRSVGWSMTQEKGWLCPTCLEPRRGGV